jgi:membrane protease YdiL (CAAX protease family)
MLQTPLNDYLYTSIAKVILFLLIPFLYYKIFKEGTYKELLSLFILKDKRDVKLPLVLGGIVFTFIVVTFIIIRPLIDSAMVDEALANIGITPGNAVFVVLYIVLINAALEQLFFRGFVFMSLYRMGIKPYAHIYSSVLFAVYHIPVLFHALAPGMLILATLGLVVAGLIFNALTVKCKSISGALIVHISANLALNLMIGIYFVFQFF